MKVLVTGAAGFIGCHTVQELKSRGHAVVSIDRVREAVSDKRERLGVQKMTEDVDLSKFDNVDRLFRRHKPECVVHLAGQYSVKYTTENMRRYVSGNLDAFTFILEAAKVHKCRRVVFASSIAVSEEGRPSGLYGATKAYNEHAAHAYSRRGLETIGLRYAAVYGPMQRADTTLYRGTRALLDGKPIPDMGDLRDCKEWIHVQDAARSAADCVEAVMDDPHAICLLSSPESPADLGHVLQAVADHAGIDPIFPGSYVPTKRPGAPDLSALAKLTGRTPDIGLREGVADFVEWMRAP